MNAEERLDVMRENRTIARTAFEKLADSASDEEQQQLQDEWDAAATRLAKAQNNGLKGLSDKLDSTVQALAHANALSKEALAKNKKTVEVLKKLEEAALIAGKVLIAAA